LEDERYPDNSRHDPDPRGGLHAALREEIIAGFGGFLLERDEERKLERFSEFRILSPERHGPGGVEALNRDVELVLRRENLIGRSPDRYSGRPLMIKTNDYSVELFNGDIGITLADTSGDGIVRALFHNASSGHRRIAISRLPERETAFAITVHKSQGSEFDAIALVLHERAALHATRELLYTAVTRAKERVSLYAGREVIRQVITRRASRESGLGDALRGLDPSGKMG
jgi:exodeoxyribonuclease V alpha subunit